MYDKPLFCHEAKRTIFPPSPNRYFNRFRSLHNFNCLLLFSFMSNLYSTNRWKWSFDAYSRCAHYLLPFIDLIIQVKHVWFFLISIIEFLTLEIPIIRSFPRLSLDAEVPVAEHTITQAYTRESFVVRTGTSMKIRFRPRRNIEGSLTSADSQRAASELQAESWVWLRNYHRVAWPLDVPLQHIIDKRSFFIVKFGKSFLNIFSCAKWKS